MFEIKDPKTTITAILIVLVLLVNLIISIVENTFTVDSQLIIITGTLAAAGLFHAQDAK